VPLAYQIHPSNDEYPAAQFIGRSDSAQWYAIVEGKEAGNVLQRIRKAWNSRTEAMQ